MIRRSNWSHFTYTFALVAAIGIAGAVFDSVGCGTSSNSPSATYATTDPYVHYVYYPSDVTVASVYWADTWVYTGLYAATYPTPVTGSGTPSTGAAGSNGATTTTGAAGAAGHGSIATKGAAGSGGASTVTAGVVTTVGDAIRALARGEAVCPGKVTVTQRTHAPACAGGPANERAGATLVFAGCQTAGGGTIDGTIDVMASRTASTASCGSGTTITLSHTTTVTNLAFTGPSGAKAIIPSMTDTGTNTYAFGQTPASITISTTGQLQTYDPSGALTSDHNFSGTPTITFASTQGGYTIDGGFNASDNINAGRGLTLTLMGVQRVNTCCRPVGGTIQVVQASGSIASHIWAFGPTCGVVTVDGDSDDAPPACL
jgi:hypothetical protein